MTEQTKPIELFYWPTPNGWKISIMLEELGVPYNVNYINIGSGDQFREEFLAISPNNKMPAIIDPEGPDGKPVSVFESGAIMLYLGRKFGQFYPANDARKQIEVEQWLMWQMGGFGPMLGQNHHFALYAPEKLPYAIKRYQDETHRLYGVLNKQLEGRDFICGEYSIADMATIGWARPHERQGINLDEFPHAKRWFEAMMAREAVQKGLAVGAEERDRLDLANNKDAQAVLFNQRG